MGIRIRIAIVMLIAGGALLVYGFYEWQLSSGASAKPEEISLRDLIARGPKGNPNIILKDFEFSGDYVHEYDEKRGPNSAWTKVWIPVFPAGTVPQPPPPGQPGGVPANQEQLKIRALVYSTKVHNEPELEAMCNRPTLRGMVTNTVQSLGADEKKHLQQDHPGTDFTNCLIIEEGREPASAGVLILIFGGGGALLLGALALLVLPLMVGRAETPTTDRDGRRRRIDRDEDEEEGDRLGRWQRSAGDEGIEEDRPRRPRRPAEDE
jgi:hypothetical protein